MKVSSLEEAIKRYGPIQNGKWENENQWMILVDMPSWFTIQVKNSATGKDTDRIYMNRDMKDAFLRAIQNTVNVECSDELKTFGGCYMIRDVRGMPGHPSTHSYGLAIDLNQIEMPLGSVSKWSEKFVKCFTDEGFTFGGTFRRSDPQHFSRAWE